MLKFRTQFYSYKVGDKMTIKYLQDGHTKTVELMLSSKPEIKSQVAEKLESLETK